MDDADRAQMDIEIQAERMTHVSTALEAEPTGQCLNCGEFLVNPAARWCNCTCRSDWSHRRERGRG